VITYRLLRYAVFIFIRQMAVHLADILWMRVVKRWNQLRNSIRSW